MMSGYRHIKLTLLSTLLTLQLSEAYKALVVFPFPSKSHGILGDNLVKLISEAGNEVTYITALPREKPPLRVKEIDVSVNKIFFPENSISIQEVLKNEISVSNIFNFITKLTELSSVTIRHEEVQKLLNDPNEKFDVVIAEWMFNDVYAGLAPVFDCPLIWLSTLEPHWKILNIIDELPNPAYNADVISSNQPPFTFLQRVQELAMQGFGLSLQYFNTRARSRPGLKWLLQPITSIFQLIIIMRCYSEDKEIVCVHNFYEKNSRPIKTNFDNAVCMTVYIAKREIAQYESIIAPIIRKRGHLVPEFEDLRYNASLVLGNSHVSTGKAVRLPQNYKAIGGYHISSDVKPLPQDLEKLFQNAEHGVIYFSLGSNLKSKSFPDDIKQSLLKMFGELKQTVLWKFEEELPNRPSNVHIVQWAPQPSILAHHNCKLFITHGGMLSTIEAVHFAKPIIGIPVFADQYSNIDRAVVTGFAKKVTLSYTMADQLKAAIQEVLGNPSFSTKAKELSYIYHDRPVPPGKELVHWVQHVVATRGAPHLRSPALLVPWYQKMYLDLALVVLGVICGLKMLLRRVGTDMRKIDSRKKNN